MPIQSQAQWGFLGAHYPKLLHKWQNEAPRKFKQLPKKVKHDFSKTKPGYINKMRRSDTADN